MTLIADVFTEIPAMKNMIREMSKNPCFKGALETEHWKWVETLLQSQ